MNNAQLDMVLGYLNEGTEIDQENFLIESLDELVENCYYESTMINSLLEADEEESKKEENKIGLGTKIKEAIKKFINWVKSLIAKLKLKINQLNIKIMSSQLKKEIEKQKAIAKNLDPNMEITFGPTEAMMFDYVNDWAEIDHGELEELIGIGIGYTDFTRFFKAFNKIPMPIMIFSSKIVNRLYKNNQNYKEIKDDLKITVEEYVESLDKMPELADQSRKIIDSTLDAYNDVLKLENDMYKSDPTKANEEISAATKIVNFVTQLSTSALKCLVVATKLTKKPLKSASK